jgi:hypothetical protein
MGYLFNIYESSLKNLAESMFPGELQKDVQAILSLLSKLAKAPPKAKKEPKPAERQSNYEYE